MKDAELEVAWVLLQGRNVSTELPVRVRSSDMAPGCWKRAPVRRRLVVDLDARAWKMSYGAPCERGVGAADTMPQRGLEVPGLVPAVEGVGLATKEARRHHSQRARRRRRREEKSSRRERSVVDRDRCLDVIAEAVDDHRQELKVISRGLDLCESTLCSDVANVRTWVTSALEEQQKMMLCLSLIHI